MKSGQNEFNNNDQSGNIDIFTSDAFLPYKCLAIVISDHRDKSRSNDIVLPTKVLEWTFYTVLLPPL